MRPEQTPEPGICWTIQGKRSEASMSYAAGAGAGWTSTSVILVLFILLVIISRIFLV
ncbi:hypothetical protein B8V81_1333 [Paenibacillus pasadenensis]|nr:hypothetical protein B8V81_1333 [Paenibacillus pasadenensis]